MRQSKWAGGRITEGFLTDSHIILSHPLCQCSFEGKGPMDNASCIIMPIFIIQRRFFCYSLSFKNTVIFLLFA